MMTLLLLILASGCSDSERVAQVALEGSKRQADLDQEMTRLNREVAQGTRRLVEARSEADQQLLAQQHDVQQQRDALETERRGIASDRARESILAPVLLTVGSLLVCSLPLILCWFLLQRLGQESAETQVTQLLVEQMAAQDDRQLLPQADSIGLPPPSDALETRRLA